MNTYCIAGLKVNMSPFGRTLSQAEKYKTEFDEKPDITLEVTEQMLEKAKQLLDYDSKEDAYYLASGFVFYRKLLSFDGFMLHSSAVCVGDDAYVFAGQSGIGKSTHTDLWVDLLGDRCVFLNDDKPAIRIEQESVYVYGTLWSGKHDKNTNKRAELKGICIIKRGEQNRIQKLPPSLAAIEIIKNCTKNFNEREWGKILSLIDEVVKKVPVYQLCCNKDISAAKLSYSTLTGEKI